MEDNLNMRAKSLSGGEQPLPTHKVATTGDNWDKGENSNFCCDSCMFFINFRCRRHAPTLHGGQGWPAVFPSDFCGDHKMGKHTIRAIVNKSLF